MESGFSEFTYGFAVTHELVTRWFGRSAVPVFPSLIAEGRPGGGYDVFLKKPGYPLFLQFKLSEFMSRRQSSEWRLFNSPYYRFWLRAPRHSDQHALLLLSLLKSPSGPKMTQQQARSSA